MGPKRHDGAMLLTSGTNKRKESSLAQYCAVVMEDSCNGCKIGLIHLSMLLLGNYDVNSMQIAEAWIAVSSPPRIGLLG